MLPTRYGRVAIVHPAEDFEDQINRTIIDCVTQIGRLIANQFHVEDGVDFVVNLASYSVSPIGGMHDTRYPPMLVSVTADIAEHASVKE